MEQLMPFVKPLILPPSGLLLLALIGWLIGRRWRLFGRLVAGLAVLTLVLLSLPIVADALLSRLQDSPPLAAEGDLPAADAIVVLGAGADRFAPEFGGVTPDWLTLERLRYGALLHRRTGLPLLLSGGPLQDDDEPLADSMAETLRSEFAVTAKWRERASRNTWENAQESAKMLRADGVKRIFLVTHSWHLPRAEMAFAGSGLTVLPAGVGYERWPQDPGFDDFVPSSKALYLSTLAVYEGLGRLWYRLGRGP